MLKRIVGALKVLVSREKLASDDSPSPDPRPSFLSWLMQPEELSAPAVSVPPRRTTLWNWLFMPEKLPPAATGGGERPDRSLVAMLLAREDLPRDPAPEKRRRSGPYVREKHKTAPGGKE